MALSSSPFNAPRSRQRRVALVLAALIVGGAALCSLAPVRHDYGTGVGRARATNYKHAPACHSRRSSHNRARIPKRLIFITVNGIALPDNVERTLRIHTGVPSALYTDDNCTRLLQAQKRHVLLHAFKHESYGPNKKDVCLAAILHSAGGFYFDNDIMPDVNVVEAAALTGADLVGATELSDGGVTPGFMGATPGHKIVRAQLDHMTAYYVRAFGHASSYSTSGLLRFRLFEQLTGTGKLIGPATLGRAIAESGASEAVYLIAETRLPFWKMRRASWQRRVGAALCDDCGVVGIDPGDLSPDDDTIDDDDEDQASEDNIQEATVMMYMRDMGSRGCPSLRRLVAAWIAQQLLWFLVVAAVLLVLLPRK